MSKIKNIYLLLFVIREIICNQICSEFNQEKTECIGCIKDFSLQKGFCVSKCQ